MKIEVHLTVGLKDLGDIVTYENVQFTFETTGALTVRKWNPATQLNEFQAAFAPGEWKGIRRIK